MGTHISKVKSIDLDMWTPEQLTSVQKWGNTRVNLYWEAHLKPGHLPPDHKMDSFIRSKYETKRWALEGPPPSDPSVLEGSSDHAKPVPAAPIEASTTEPVVLPAAPVVSPPALIHDPSASTSRTLLSTAHTRAPSASTVTATTSTNNQNDLFSLDFSASRPDSTAMSVPPKDVKQDIMSLFTSNPKPPASAPSFGLVAPQSITAGGSAWAQDSWNFPANNMPMDSNHFGSGVNAWQNSQFSAPQNVWAANSGQNGSMDLFNTPGTVQPASKKQDDAFGDLWGGFK
ncbi:hypothetical protein FRC16_010272 [Serendipita sp. 398]|nr:hypothetical protein FRC16_010272 [Serendipita sp. 398]